MGPMNTELVPDFTDIFQTMELFDSRGDLNSWVRERGIPVGIVVIVRRSDAGSDTRNPRLVLSYERGGYPRVIKKKPPTERDYIQQNLDDEVSDEEKERKNSKTSSKETGSKRIGCPFV
ncbi:ARM repeat superfamily protein [Perilla frutescens var. frutescens]|nr:ARM repeat superfamily protein [Perilla frutescens var. frutescens]